MDHVSKNGWKDVPRKCVKYLRQFKLRHRSILIFFSILATAIIYIFYPLIFNHPLVRINGISEHIDLNLSRDFKTCTLIFKNDINIFNYSMKPSPSAVRQVVKRPSKDVGQTLRSLKIENLLDPKNIPTNGAIKVRIIYRNLFPIELSTVKVDGQEVVLKSFFKNNILNENKSYIDRQYIREDISLLLLKYNDPVSNVILVIGAFYLFILMYRLIEQVRLYPRKTFEGYIKARYSLSSESKNDELEHAQLTYMIEFQRNDKWFRFLQVIGPALGFTITISSLIAGLHPYLRETQNVTKFFETIQVAMVSTLIGLLVRIVAVSLQKINDKLFIQADEIFSDLKKDGNQ